MTWIPGGTFWMGSAGFYPEESPVHQVTVDSFWMDERPVTVAEYRRFVAATGYLTVAERPLDPADYPEADPALLVPGSLVFHRTKGRLTCRITATGGRTCRGPAGGGPPGRAATGAAAGGTR
jgi:formylglycine-generating enzyme required for sulfatase activity